MHDSFQEKLLSANLHTVIDAKAREKLIDWQELWRYRDLFYILAWRENRLVQNATNLLNF